MTNEEATEVNTPPSELPNRYRKLLVLFLQFIGYTALLAFGAAVMPKAWMVAIAKILTIDPFPAAPLTFYLARNLSLVYGFVGIGVLIIANDVHRYGPMVRQLAMGTMAFGILQLVCNEMSAMPWWWTLGEGLSTFGGGVTMFWLNFKSDISR